MTMVTPNGQQLPVNVVGSSTFGLFNKISSEKTYNLFISDEWLVNFPGYSRILDFFPAGEGRGIFRSIRGNFLLIVVNSAVIVLQPNLGYITVGNLATNTGEVYIDENLNSQICIVDGVNAYIYNYPGGVVTQQVLAPAFVPNYVEFHNTFFLFGNNAFGSAGSAWYAYSFSTPTTITLAATMALQFKPDYALAVVRIPGQGGNVLVIGSAVCEVHTAVSGPLPYRRNSTINVDYGCVSVSTIDSSDEYIAWLGFNEKNTPAIIVYSGQGATAISTDGIDHQMDQIQFPAQSSAMFVRFNGHLFYQLTFYNPADNLTLTYDFETKKFYHLCDQNVDYHPARHYAFLGQNIYFISIKNASLYQTGIDFTFINESVVEDPKLKYEMERIRICSNIMQEDSDRFIANYFTFTLEQGNDPNVTGASLDVDDYLITESFFTPPITVLWTEQGFNMEDEDAFHTPPNMPGNMIPYIIPYNPAVDLTISLDGGITWSSTVRRDLNQSGYRKNRISWNKLGSSNSMTLKLRFWAFDRFVANNGVLEIY